MKGFSTMLAPSPDASGNNRPGRVAAEVSVAVATAQLVHFSPTGPACRIMHPKQTFWLDLCLTSRPRNARACYFNHWDQHRFVPMGRLFMLPPGETFKTQGEGGPTQTSVLCHLQPDTMQQWLDQELRWTDRRLEGCLDIREARVGALLQRLAQELREPGFGSQTMVELLALQLGIELRRYCSAIGEDSGQPRGLSAERLRLIDERLSEVRETPSLAELAQLCQLSVRQLTQAFRLSRGCSVGKYVAEARLDQAKRLLAGGQSIKAIAYTLGFSPASFSITFRRATGETPRQYRMHARLSPRAGAVPR
jgi:AraC family transcriptional regulator